MDIWFKSPSLEDTNERGKRTLVEFLGIKVVKIGQNYLEGTMEVMEKNRQPLGYLHGGASCVLAESLGSIGANLVLNPEKEYAVGLEINANHLRPVAKGFVLARATSLHLGKRTQVWEIKLRNEKNQLTCVARLTMAVVKKT